MATALCLMATLTGSVALGTSALTTAVVTLGADKTLQYMHTSSCQKKRSQLPQTKPLLPLHECIQQDAQQHNKETAERITAWAQLPDHLHTHWINAEQDMQHQPQTAATANSTKTEQETLTPPQLMAAQAKRARFMATCQK